MWAFLRRQMSLKQLIRRKNELEEIIRTMENGQYKELKEKKEAS